MEEKAPVNKGYQKQLKKEETVQPKKNAVDYSSPLAKKWPDLKEAVENGNVDAVKKLMDEGLNVNLARGGVTPLMIAAAKGRLEVAKLLLESGVDINAKNDDGWTALHIAAAGQAGAPIVELLIQSGINVAARNNAGKTALELAEQEKHADIVKTIKKIQSGKEQDAKEWKEFLDSPDGKPYKASLQLEIMKSYSPLWILPILAMGGVGLLFGFVFGLAKSLAAGLILSLLFNAGYFRRMKMLQKYLDGFGPLPELDIHLLREKRRRGKSVTVLKKTDLPLINDVPAKPAAHTAFSATAAGDAAVHSKGARIKPAPPAAVRMVERRKVVLRAVAILLAAGAGTGIFYHDLIVKWYHTYHDPIAKWYYTERLKLHGTAFTDEAFLDAVAKNDKQTVELLIGAGIAGTATNEKGQSGLNIAAEKGYASLIDSLVKLNRSLLRGLDSSGRTPLMTAAFHGRDKTVRSLVECGADVNQIITGQEGAASALQAALDAPDFKEEHLQIVKYLLEKGADVKARNAAGRAPLLFSSVHGRLTAAKLLSERGADLNAANRKGETPLLAAACGGYADFVMFLADQGANIKIASSEGQTPLMCAARGGHLPVINILLDRGADINAKTTKGFTALTDASLAGQVEAVKLLLQRGAVPGSGSVPDTFRDLSGKPVEIRMRNKGVKAALKRIVDTAQLDGYTVKAESVVERKMTGTLKGPWNVVLTRLAKKNSFFLVVHEREVHIIPINKRKTGGS